MNRTGSVTRRIFLGACSMAPLACWSEARSAPPLMLANTYRSPVHLADYLVSEKLDGVRAYWDGGVLMTRTGRPIFAPGWFIAELPSTPLDGELWGGRGMFERTSSIVRRHAPDDSDWRDIGYMLFDLPAVVARFDDRLAHLRRIVEIARIGWMHVIPQVRLSTERELFARLREVEAGGGEGLMLHRSDSFYLPERTDHLLKVKSFDDAEAQVIGHIPGKGKFADVMGALLVRREDGAEFKVGSGFSDTERAAPPPLGSWITYAYNGQTNSGLPRFPRYIRVHIESEK